MSNLTLCIFTDKCPRQNAHMGLMLRPWHLSEAFKALTSSYAFSMLTCRQPIMGHGCIPSQEAEPANAILNV